MSNAERTMRVPVMRVDTGRPIQADDAVAVERGLEVRIDDESFAVIMRTPGADPELAAGFLFSEGITAARADVVTIGARDGDVVTVRLAAEAGDRARHGRDDRRRVAMTASCGMCGRASLAALTVEAPVVDASWTMEADGLSSLPMKLAERQRAFAETGGLHAAALIDRDGAVVDAAEDVGRHNAVDKIIGRAWLGRRLPLSDALLFVSGRTSFEIVQKAWLAGIPFVAAVSAPSSLAIELAERAGITLVGFVRERRFNVYAGAHRVNV